MPHPSSGYRHVTLSSRMSSQYRKGVRNAISTVLDTFRGRAVRHSATRKTQASFGLWQSQGPMKILSKAVVAWLPFTILARRVRTVLKL